MTKLVHHDSKFMKFLKLIQSQYNFNYHILLPDYFIFLKYFCQALTSKDAGLFALRLTVNLTEDCFFYLIITAKVAGERQLQLLFVN